MQGAAAVLTAELGPNVASVIAESADTGQPMAVVNSAARRDPALREEAERSLSAFGIAPDAICEVLDGVRS